MHALRHLAPVLVLSDVVPWKGFGYVAFSADVSSSPWGISPRQSLSRLAIVDTKSRPRWSNSSNRAAGERGTIQNNGLVSPKTWLTIVVLVLWHAKQLLPWAKVSMVVFASLFVPTSFPPVGLAPKMVQVVPSWK